MQQPLPLVGRDAEAAALLEAIGEHRLVTVTGPAGVGKSAIVRHVLAGRATRCSLGGCRSGREVLRALGEALGLAPTGSALAAAVERALGRRERTLVLDGADGASGALREWLPRWLERCRAVRFVVTAQRRLELEAEHPVELPLPSTEQALRIWHDATCRLGHESAPAAASQIVELLDRLPLALEWWAPRAALLGDAACLDRMRRHVDRDDPLTAAVIEAVGALDDADRAALATIAMFEQGLPTMTLDRAGIGLDTLERLSSRALVRAAHGDAALPRVVAYRTVRQQLRNSAKESGRWDALARDHAGLVCELAERPTPGSFDEIAAGRMRLLTALRPELEAVVDRFETRDQALALRACLAWCPLAHHDGTADATTERLGALLAAIAEPEPAALLALGSLERKLGQLDLARAHLTAARDRGDPFDALIELAHLDRMQSRLAQALGGYEAALAWAVRQGDTARKCVGLGELGRMLQTLGQNRRAQERHQEAIALARSLGLREREALERSLHARATHRAGSVREAIALHEQALAMYRELGHHRLAAAEQGHLAFCHHEAGLLTEAERLFRASVDGLADVGDVALECIERTLLARLLADQDRFTEAKLELAIVETVTRELGLPRVELTRCFVAGLTALGQDDVVAAEARFAEGLALGLHLEVGFEALLPAYLALTRSRGGNEATSALLAQSAERVAEREAPGLRAALAVLAAAVHGERAPEVSAELLATSSDTRRALRLAAKIGTAPALRIAVDGQRVELPDGRHFDFGRSAAPRRLLLALARARQEQPGRTLSPDELIAAGWPGERMRPDAARQRLRTAIWSLRKLGLEPLLLTRDDGYLLDPAVPLVMR